MKTLKFIFPILAILLVCNLTSKAQGNLTSDMVFKIVEKMPEYPGGKDALRKDIAAVLKYPAKAKEQGISGKVYVSFVVDEKGKIINPKIARGVDEALDKEALRVMSLLKTWEPGSQRGTLVKVEYTLPITFDLNGDSKEKGNNKEHSNSDKNEKQVFKIVEDMPEFPGGDTALRTFIAENVKYPEEAKKDKIQGKVFVVFVVGKDGETTDAKIARGVHPTLDKEALSVVNDFPTWKPGSQRGQTVNVQYTVPINFVLN